MKKLLVVFDKKNSKDIAIDEDDITLRSFLDFFIRLSKFDVDIYIARDFDCNVNGNTYLANFIFDPSKNDFAKYDKTIVPDVIWDRCITNLFPTPNGDIDCINTFEFKQIDSNKYFQYKILKDKMPYSFVLTDIKSAIKSLENIKASEVIVKPINGYGGKGIVKMTKEELVKSEALFEKYGQYLCQEFLDINLGIKGLVSGPHDIRLYSTNNKIIRSYIRMPKKGGFLANLSQGGELNEIEIDQVPSNIVEFALPIINMFYTTFDNPFFSVDIMVSNNRPYVIEINGASVGFPFINSIGRDHFIEEFSKRILKIWKP